MENMKDVIEFLKEAEESGVNHRLAQLYIDKAKADMEKAREALDRAKEEATTLKQEYEYKLDSCPVEGMQKTKIKKMVEDRLDQMFELGLITLPEGLPDEDVKPTRRKRRTRKSAAKAETEEATTQTTTNTPTDESAAPDAPSSSQTVWEPSKKENDSPSETVKDALNNKAMLNNAENPSDKDEEDSSDEDVATQVESNSSAEQVFAVDHSDNDASGNEDESATDSATDTDANNDSESQEASNEDDEYQIPAEVLQNEDFDGDESDEDNDPESDVNDSIKMPSFLQ